MFKKVVTEQYPEEKVPTQPRYHGRHQLNRHPDGLEKCIGCELCAWACPADAIFVEGAPNTEEERFSPGERYGRVYQINYLRCIFCGLCIEACPTRALTMTNEYELADDSRAALIYEKQDLLGAAAARHGRRRRTRWCPARPRPTTTSARSPARSPCSRRGRGAQARHLDRSADRRGGDGVSALLAARRDHRQHRRDRSCSGSAPSSRSSARSACCSRSKAVHSALFIASTMISLAVLYVAQSGAVPRHDADRRLHRRGHDAVPVRPHDRRRRLLRLARGDDQGPARRGDHRSALGFAGAAHRRHRLGHLRPRSGSTRPTPSTAATCRASRT